MENQIEQLRNAGDWARIRQLLTEFTPQQNWAEARYAREGNYNGYLRDLEVLQDWAIEQQDLALSIHCSLIASSIRSIKNQLSGELLVQLINVGTTKGKWSIELALNHIEQSSQWQVSKLVALIDAGLNIPWERGLNIVKQSEPNQYQLEGYFTIYPLTPLEIQTTILDNIFQLLPQLEFFQVSKLLKFLHQLTHEWQNRFMHYIFQAENIYQTYNFPNWQQILDTTPIDWQPQMLHFIENKLQATEKLYCSSFVENIALLPKHQQQLEYWDLSLQTALKHDLTPTMLDLLPTKELHGLLELALQIKIDPEKFTAHNAYTLLVLYTHYFPQHSQLFDTAIAILSHYAYPLHRPVLELLPESYQEQLAKQLIEVSPKRYKFPIAMATWQWEHQYRDLLDFVPNLRLQLIKILQQQGDTLFVLPYLPHEQQIQQVEQYYQNSRLINDQPDQARLQARLSQIQARAGILKNIQTQLPLVPQAHSIPDLEKLLQAAPELSDTIYEYLISLEQIDPETSRLLPYFNHQQQTTLAKIIFQQPNNAFEPDPAHQHSPELPTQHEQDNQHRPKQAAPLSPQEITQLAFKEGIDCYLALHEQHHILAQADYYQSLLAYIQTHQTEITTLEYHIFEQLSSYLNDHDAQILFHTYAKLNDKVFLNQYITNYLQRTGYLSLQRIIELIKYASQQPRSTNFALQQRILPAYIETLAPEQAQQLASQINQTVEQVCACWP